MTKAVVLLIGLPGSGKTTFADSRAAKPGTVVLSRDKRGGSLKDLVPEYEAYLKDPNVKEVVLDNTHLTKGQRKLFLDPAREAGIKVTALWFRSPISFCEIRVLLRNSVKVIPPYILLEMAKSFEEPDPSSERGLTSVKQIRVPPPSWDPSVYTRKALFLDVDGTLRDVSHLPKHFPVREDEVVLIRPANQMCKVLAGWVKRGYVLVAISNQSGIARKLVSEARVKRCFRKVLELLHNCVHMEFLFCPHFASLAGCYCRKPHPGMIVTAAQRWHIDPSRSIVVGDQKSDEQLAANVNCRFIDASTFFL